MWKNWNCYAMSTGIYKGTATMGNSIEVPQTIKNRIISDLGILFLDIYPKELKIGCQRDTCTLMFRIALLTVAKRWQKLKWVEMDNQMVAYTHNVRTYTVHIFMEKRRNRRRYIPQQNIIPH